MSRTLTTPMGAAVASPITRPGYLIEIDFSPKVRISTVGDVMWDGFDWLGNRHVEVAGLSDQGGQIRFGNVDSAFAALVLGEGVADRAITVWAADATALADDDPVLVFEGVGDAAEVTVETASITLRAAGSASLYSPRRFVGLSAGFTQLVPSGATFSVGNQKITLERAR